MTPDDLKPESVDTLPERTPKPQIIVLPYKKGHIYDPLEIIPTFGIEAADSNGEKWRVFEDKDGLFKFAPPTSPAAAPASPSASSGSGDPDSGPPAGG